MSTNKYTRKHYHTSSKSAGPVHADSSYELRASIILDQDPQILHYEDHQCFISNDGQTRIFDFLATCKNGDKKLIEVKPYARLKQFEKQIQDNKDYAEKMGWIFEIWTEKELGFDNSKKITNWADQYIKENTGIDYSIARKQKDCMKAKRYYRKKIANDKVEVPCVFCNEVHMALRLTYDKNIARNGRYICEREGGHIAGSKPKLSLRKDNPYSSDGKKECNKCKEVKLFEQFSPDKSKRDGYCTMCKPCRSEKMKASYESKKKKK